MDTFDYEELFCAMFGITDEDRDAPDFDIFLECDERFMVDFEAFCSIAKALLAFTPVAQSPLTKAYYHAFIVQGIAYLKQEAPHHGKKI